MAEQVLVREVECLSCGASLVPIGDESIVQCEYCGVSAALTKSDSRRLRETLLKLVNLCQVAAEAKNHDDVIRYANRILEIDPTYIDAWIDKAKSTFHLSTGADPRYGEALAYLNQASQLAPGDERIDVARQELEALQAWWLNRLGNKSLTLAKEIYGLYAGTDGFRARERSREHFAEAMEYFLEASSHAPDDIVILRNILTTYKSARWLNWRTSVYEKMRLLQEREAEERKYEKVRSIETKLKAAASDLDRLSKHQGWLARYQRQRASRRFAKLGAKLDRMSRSHS